MDRETNKFVQKKNAKKHKSSKRKKQVDTSCEESIDVTEKMFPIAHYINDREEMIRQVFSVMEKEKLNCMLPPILKGMTLGALKEKCLKELTKMSDDAVQKVLCGDTIEGLAKVPAPLNIDSDSCQSLSSVEECTNTEKEKRTLLDILEQEMQEIAYNTVLKRTEKPETESDDGLPEIVAITPTHSPSRAENSVLLICLDSGDDEPGKPLCESFSEVKPKQLKNHEVAHEEGEAVVPQNLIANANSETVLVNRNTASFVDMSSSGSPLETGDLNLGHLSNSNNSQESFMIQVFSRNTASERIVKKISKLSNSELDFGQVPIVNTEETQSSNPDKKNELPDCDKKKLLSKNLTIIDENTIVNPSEVEILEGNIAPGQGSQFCDTAISQLVDSCISIEDSIKLVDVAHNKTTSEKHLEEKEEGEITEEESEEDVEILGCHEEQHQSTILLSSDGSDVTSGHEKQDHRNKVRKHHHRSKGSRRNAASPERTRRRIEKRGNRSYRRKTTTIVKENENLNEEVKKAVPDYHTSSDSTQIPVEVAVTDGSTKSESTLPDNGVTLQVVEEIKAEICDPPTSPNTLEIHIADTKLDSSEETEGIDSAEPVPTKTSWADRWAEKKDLKKVVITSKICQNVRKRILSARRKKKETNPEPCTTHIAVMPPVPPLVLHVEGSVQEYQMLQLLDNEEKNELNPQAESLPCVNNVAVDSGADPNHRSELAQSHSKEHNETTQRE